MWNPWDYGQSEKQRGSFVQKATPPAAEPGCDALVQVWWNTAWTPVILGALMQLCQPSSWDTSDPVVLQTTLRQATGLLAQVAKAAQTPLRGPRPITSGAANCTWVQNRPDGDFVLNS